VVDLRVVGEDAFLVKTEVVDLLLIADSAGIAGPAREGDFGIGSVFRFPFQTIESVLHLDGNVLLVVDDNNYYSFSTGRNPGRPDDSEIILVRLERNLPGTTPGQSVR
jgi:hypothetical protein